jgi:hypothetical protein
MEDLKEAKILYKEAYRHYDAPTKERKVISDNPREYYRIVDERYQNYYFGNIIEVSKCRTKCRIHFK